MLSEMHLQGGSGGSKKGKPTDVDIKSVVWLVLRGLVCVVVAARRGARL